jgi:hypothetical protein
MPDEGGGGWPFLLLAEFVKHILVHTIPARLSSDFLDTDGSNSICHRAIHHWGQYKNAKRF